MSAPLRFLRETHLIGSRCRELMVDGDHFPFIRKAHLRWVGMSTLLPPYRMVRLRSIHSHVVVCLEGNGNAYAEGQVLPWGPGQVLLAPVGMTHGFEAVGAKPWKLAWIFFDDLEKEPALSGNQVELKKADVGDFADAVRLLTREGINEGDPAALAALTTVVVLQARRLAGMDTHDTRLLRLWREVEESLSAAWTVDRMAARAAVSPEHLRRLCHRHFQRSPADHLTHLRLRRAASLLKLTTKKLDDIARLTGYASVYSFSAAFKRWAGEPPARFRSAGRERTGTCPPRIHTDIRNGFPSLPEEPNLEHHQVVSRFLPSAKKRSSKNLTPASL